MLTAVVTETRVVATEVFISGQKKCAADPNWVDFLVNWDPSDQKKSPLSHLSYSGSHATAPHMAAHIMYNRQCGVGVVTAQRHCAVDVPEAPERLTQAHMLGVGHTGLPAAPIRRRQSSASSRKNGPW